MGGARLYKWILEQKKAGCSTTSLLSQVWPGTKSLNAVLCLLDQADDFFSGLSATFTFHAIALEPLRHGMMNCCLDISPECQSIQGGSKLEGRCRQNQGLG